MRVPQVSERIKEAPAQALRGVFAGIGQLLLVTDRIRHKHDVPQARVPETAETVPDAAVTSPAEPAAAAAADAVADGVAEPVAEAAATETGAVAETTAPAEAAVTPAPAEAAVTPEAAATAAPARRTTTRRTAAKATAAKATPEPAADARAADAPAADAKPAAAKPAAAKPRKQSTRNFDKTGNVRVLAGEADGSEVVITTEPAPVVTPEAVAAETAVTAAAPPLANYDALTVASLRARLRSLDIAQVRQLAEYERAHQGREDVLGMYERRIAKLEAEA